MKNQFVTWGYISKQEVLKTLSLNIMPGTLVLESVEPFPGYHGKNLPDDSVPSSIFLVTSKNLADEDILRTSEKINASFRSPFDATPADINLYNETFSAIRVYDLNGYDCIADLQENYKNEGVEFKKKRNIKDVALIRIKKSFTLTEAGEGIYSDLANPKMHYLKIPHISWNLFEQVSKTIKNNVDYINFDAALGMFYLGHVTDVVRLYAKDIDMGYLKMLKDKYNQEIADFFI